MPEWDEQSDEQRFDQLSVTEVNCPTYDEDHGKKHGHLPICAWQCVDPQEQHRFCYGDTRKH